MVSVTPEIVDPSITYVELDSIVYYNQSKTTLNDSQLKAEVIQSLSSYRSTSDLRNSTVGLNIVVSSVSLMLPMIRLHLMRLLLS